MRWAERWLGQNVFSALARPTLYSQFVGGDEEERTEVDGLPRYGGGRGGGRGRGEVRLQHGVHL